MKVAVVGSGIGGISAAYHLAKDGHEVVLLEKNETLGGHTYEMEIDGEMVDIGFMMFGDSNPNVKAWFKSLGLTEADGTTKKRIPMSLTVTSKIKGDLQFSSRSPFHGSVLNLFDLRIWRVLRDIYRFTMDLMTMPVKEDITTREWIAEGRYSKEFFHYYFLAFVSILWTVPKNDVLDLPVTQFLRCLKTHSNSLYIPLWQVIMRTLGRRSARPKHLWWYIGSAYIEPFIKIFTEEYNGTVRYNATVDQVEKGGKAVILEGGERIECDHVVLATHADESAHMLRWSEKSHRSLMRFYFHKSMMYVHRDPALLPKSNKVWSSWNVLICNEDQYILTYWMNRIQHLNSKKDVFVTITPYEEFEGQRPDEDKTISAFRWDHPRLLADCIPQDDIIQEEGVTLSGCWLGRGFHEDGFVAGRRAAAIIRDPKHRKTALYEDPGNIATPAVPPFGVPLSFHLFGATVVGLVGYGVAKYLDVKF
ncbi:L-amino-acid oxidase [Phytophthora citrophthora]|uniref:L-amino-acid oxidase n=1 Tax=Phytophthora citrophthora TaxID=4793 RepID=A0AAD9GKG7_9STRA|nr:L-amino-acid oxidase [Phytophthora citrophthora]